MVFLQLVGVAAQLPIHVIQEEGIAITTPIALEVSLVEATTAKETIPRREVTGLALPIAVKVFILSYCPRILSSMNDYRLVTIEFELLPNNRYCDIIIICIKQLKVLTHVGHCARH